MGRSWIDICPNARDRCLLICTVAFVRICTVACTVAYTVAFPGVFSSVWRRGSGWVSGRRNTLRDWQGSLYLRMKVRLCRLSLLSPSPVYPSPFLLSPPVLSLPHLTFLSSSPLSPIFLPATLVSSPLLLSPPPSSLPTDISLQRIHSECPAHVVYLCVEGRSVDRPRPARGQCCHILSLAVRG